MKGINKIVIVFLVLVMVVTTLPLGIIVEASDMDKSAPLATLSGFNVGEVENGGSVSLYVVFKDNQYVHTVHLNNQTATKFIKLNGFTGNITVTGTTTGSKEVARKITISNIQGTGNSKSITVYGGAATDAYINPSNNVTSGTFNIKSAAPATDKVAPVATLSGPSLGTVNPGGSVSYTINFTDNQYVHTVHLNNQTATKFIKLNGFTANIVISGTGNSKTITLNNIQGLGNSKSITVYGGAATDAYINPSNAVTSAAFNVVKKDDGNKPDPNPNPNPNPGDNGNNNNNNNNNNGNKNTIPSKKVTQTVQTKVVASCEDSNLGDVNPEITHFASWLRAEKYTAGTPQENNYVAKDQTMTYMVEYYNGSTAPVPTANFKLTIPHGAVIEEINGNGKATVQESDKTVVEWNVANVQYQAKCRLYVRVKFLEDTNIEKSNDIQREFYPELLTTANGNTSYSYMRQLFIDLNLNKRGIVKNYLMAIDPTNAIRPNEEITRAEFAKLLADSGILKVEANSTKYKIFSDADKIPEYARDAVSALVGTNIIEAFDDGSFKPENPIVKEDLLQMIANASNYMSGTKLTEQKAVFLYTEALKDSNGNVSSRKNAIMELMRQNVIPKYKTGYDKYATRAEAVTIINALTNRGPYVQNLPNETIKFMDIMNHTYFYDIIGAANSYEYKYDYRLWQEITSIK